jgi:DNA-binding CsgD family transcriptional regulator
VVDIGSAERAVLRVCRSGLDVTELQRQVLATLRTVMTIDAAFFGTADPETLLFTGSHSEEPLIAMAPMFLDNELGGRDVNTFPGLVRVPGHVRSLDAATSSERMASPRYRDIMRPVGLGDELRAALVVGGHCWGYLCLHREDGALGFTTAEAEIIRRLAPHIAHALRQAVLLHRPVSDEERRPGVVLLDERMELVASTPEADALLPLIGHGSTRLPLPVSVYSVAAALATADQPASLRVRAATGGWLSLHASRLRTQIAVVVEPAEPQSTLGLLLAAYGLTPRELDIARHVLRGDSTKVIANALHISAHTVQDHLKSVFDKVGVRSRRDLVGRLLAGPGHSVAG